MLRRQTLFFLTVCLACTYCVYFFRSLMPTTYTTIPQDHHYKDHSYFSNNTRRQKSLPTMPGIIGIRNYSASLIANQQRKVKVSPPYNETPLCPTLTYPTDGTWVADEDQLGHERLDNRSHSSRRRGHYRSPTCHYEMLTRKQIRNCFRKRTIMFVGDSLIRGVLLDIIKIGFPELIPPHGGDLFNKEDGSYHKDHTFVLDELEGAIMFKWSPSAFYVPPYHAWKRERKIDFVLLSFTLWDMHSNDGVHSAQEFYTQLLNNLKEFRLSFRRTLSAFYMLHRIDQKDNTFYGLTSQYAFRNATLCALYDGNLGIGVMDFWGPTNDELARSIHYLGTDGVHPKQILVELSAIQLLNGFCNNVLPDVPRCNQGMKE
eukprot:PhF_6_TR23830/c0_g1_i1/m.33412